MLSKTDILKNISIVKVAEECSINLERVSSGNFDYRCKCPSREHKHASERTSSCYINSIDNNFYCFGCNAGYNVIDFYILSEEVGFSDAMNFLRDLGRGMDISATSSVTRRANLPILIDMYSFLRRYKDMFISDDKWMNSFSQKIDLYVDKIDRYDVDSTKRLFTKVKNKLQKRYGSA